MSFLETSAVEAGCAMSAFAEAVPCIFLSLSPATSLLSCAHESASVQPISHPSLFMVFLPKRNARSAVVRQTQRQHSSRVSLAPTTLPETGKVKLGSNRSAREYARCL